MSSTSARRSATYLERRYAPYAKWFGTAFQRLACSAQLYEPLGRMLAARTLDDRERAWTIVVERTLALHEHHQLLARGRYAPADVYAGRRGIGIPAFGPSSIHDLVAELRSHITDPEVLALPPRLGSINQMFAVRDLEDDAPRWRTWFRRA